MSASASASYGGVLRPAHRRHAPVHHRRQQTLQPYENPSHGRSHDRTFPPFDPVDNILAHRCGVMANWRPLITLSGTGSPAACLKISLYVPGADRHGVMPYCPSSIRSPSVSEPSAYLDVQYTVSHGKVTLPAMEE